MRTWVGSGSVGFREDEDADEADVDNVEVGTWRAESGNRQLDTEWKNWRKVIRSIRWMTMTARCREPKIHLSHFIPNDEDDPSKPHSQQDHHFGLPS